MTSQASEVPGVKSSRNYDITKFGECADGIPSVPSYAEISCEPDCKQHPTVKTIDMTPVIVDAQIPGNLVAAPNMSIEDHEVEQLAPEPAGISVTPTPFDMPAMALDIVQRRNWQIFPVHTPGKDGLCTCGITGCTNAGKHPRTQNGLKDSSSSSDEIRQWWARWSNANIGIPTGKTNFIVVLDVDPRHGGDKSLAKLEQRYGKLPSTFTVRTGGDGVHFYFTRWTGQKIKSMSNALGDEYPGIDVKSEGGYVIGPGSLHVSGSRYEVANDVDLVDVPEWLETLLVNPAEKTGNGMQNTTVTPFELPPKIPEGARNDTMFKLAASLRTKVLGEPEIRAALMEVNRSRCDPPLSGDEIARTASSAGSYPAGKSQSAISNAADSGSYSGITELAAADRFVEKISGECVWNISVKKWYVWSGKVWKIDERNVVKNRCRTFVKSLYTDIGHIDGKHGRAEYLSDVEKLNTRRGIDNIVALAAIPLTKRSEDFDSNPHILNLQNGTIEFKPTGINFREHRKEDMCSFIGGCEYRPEAPVPDIWINHVNKIAFEDPDLAKTMQTVWGYILEGGNPLEKVSISYGGGRNGKSVTYRIFSCILGGYAVTVNPLTLMQIGNKTVSPERLKMRNARLIIAQEPNKSADKHQKDTSVLDSGFLKAASGKDIVSARNLYSNTIEEFTISGVVMLITNPLPTINDRSVAFWDRLLLFPFYYYFRPEERDAHIEHKFNAVLPGILNWFIQGWQTYQKTNTIELCETVKLVLDDYRSADDEYAAFIQDCIEECKNAEVPASALYDAYVNWSKCRYLEVKKPGEFGNDMSTRLFKKRKTSGNVYRDIRLKVGQQQVTA